MTPSPRTARDRVRAPAASVVACLVGLLCYLLMPAVHAFHLHPHEGHGGEHHHDHGDEGEHEEPAQAPHDSHACDVCRVYLATQLGTDLPAPSEVWGPGPEFVERLFFVSDSPVVATWACDRRLRGPPA